MKRFMLSLLTILMSFSVLADNTVQKLFKSVDQGVVELHVKSLAQPEPGQVAYKANLAQSLGSGVVISKEGRILTAAHVVDKATQIEVIFADGSKTSGHVVWIDALIDLAMIQAGKLPNHIKPLPLAEKGNYQIGDQLIVIGAPFGVSHSLSVGYLSGVRDQEEIPGTKLIPRFLQTDAAINMGNSGGPMFNMKGEVIGIVSHILSRSGGNNGLGFAVSIDTILDVIESSPGHFSGFIPFLLNEQLSVAINNTKGYGVLVQNVIPGTLADKLGFKGGTLNVVIGRTPIILGGDILLSIDGYSLKDLAAVNKVKQHIAGIKKGSKVSIVYLRNGVEKTVTWEVD